MNGTMRAFHGQFSDNQPIRRNLAEKQKQLRDLKETLGSMKAHTSPALRDSVRKRIAELEVELRGAGAPKPEAQRTGALPARPLRGI
ncbi:MAG: hypothetical protein INR65_06965 [Gluconacetobacter diazotrophicus]|nr:hypothetical protein [Gluconacetobacter diazotrophicus]